MADNGEWLAMGGKTAHAFGGGMIEVRIATGRATWEWRTLTAEQINILIAYANSPAGKVALGKLTFHPQVGR